MEEKILKKVEEYVKQISEGESSGHDWWHVRRVYDLSKEINQEEKSNGFVVGMIALLHDVYDDKFVNEDTRKCLIELMKKLEIYDLINYEEKENIIHSICNLSFKGGFNKVLISKEGEIVQDADRLDAIGAIGIARVFAYNGKKGNEIYNPDVGIVEIKNEKEYRELKRHAINHFYEKLLKIKNTINTKRGKEIAIKRTEFMEEYLKEFYDEWEGIK